MDTEVSYFTQSLMYLIKRKLLLLCFSVPTEGGYGYDGYYNGGGYGGGYGQGYNQGYGGGGGGGGGGGYGE